MSTPQERIAEEEQTLTFIEAIAERNARLIRRALGHTGFTDSLELVDVRTNLAVHALDKQCDPINRDMLNGAYRQVGIDPGNPSAEREYGIDGNDDRRITYSLPQGVNIVERYLRDSSGASFDVSVHSSARQI